MDDDSRGSLLHRQNMAGAIFFLDDETKKRLSSRKLNSWVETAGLFAIRERQHKINKTLNEEPARPPPKKTKIESNG